jgi:hypothetical protein
VAILNERRRENDRQADDQQQDGERKDPGRQPHVLGQHVGHLKNHPPRYEVDPQHLPKGPAVAFLNESLHRGTLAALDGTALRP